MKPTVGRIVHYYTPRASEQSNNRGTGPYAAVIVGLCGTGDDPNQMVNLLILSDHAALFCVGSVCGQNTADRLEDERCWQWPPREESGVTIAQHEGVDLDADSTG